MSLSPHITRVAVLRGGPSDMYEHSLETGRQIISNMPEEYLPLDIFISRDGVWHHGGFEKSPQKVLLQVDMVINALHGPYGEDGRVQKILESFNIPYNGSLSVASALGMNKALSKRVLNKYGIKSPAFVKVDQKEFDQGVAVEKVFTGVPFPIIVKPQNSGAGFGISKVLNKSQLTEAIERALSYSDNVIAEEFIEGKEVLGGTIEDFRGQKMYSLFPQILDGSTLSQTESEAVQNLARTVHSSLGLRHYSEADFIFHPRRGLYFLEVNTLPHISQTSKFVRSLESVGASIREFVTHLLEKVRK